MLLQQIINGITLGSIYALMSLGYTMVYGILKFINFAHSEIIMLGAYFGAYSYFLLTKINIFSLYASPFKKILTITFIFFISMVLTGLTGIIVECLAYRPLRNSPRLMPLISAIGVSFFLQNLVMLITGPESKPMPFVVINRTFEVGKVSISGIQIFIVVISILMMVFLKSYIHLTKTGTAIRAASIDMNTAQLMGINVNYIISITFFIGAALGGVAGLLNGIYYGSIKYNMGFLPGIKAFASAVIGGIGNITGALIGACFLGIVESLSAGYISSMYKDVIAFILLILVLLFRPQGILGEPMVDKV